MPLEASASTVATAAASCGLPVIHSDTGWFWGYDKKNKVGEIVPEKDWNTDAYNKAIDKIIKGSYEPRECAKDFTIQRWIKSIKTHLQ